MFVGDLLGTLIVVYAMKALVSVRFARCLPGVRIAA
jgi:hypothetical protein